MSDIEERASLLPQSKSEGTSLNQRRTASTLAKVAVACSLVLASVVAISSMYPGVNSALSTKVTSFLNVPGAVSKYDNDHGPNGEVYCNELGQGECLERVLGYCTKHGPCEEDPNKNNEPTELPTSQPTTIFLSEGCNPDDPPCKEWFLGICTLHYHCHEKAPCPDDGEKKAVDDDNKEEGPTEGGAPIEPAPEPAPEPVEPAPEPAPEPVEPAPEPAPEPVEPAPEPAPEPIEPAPEPAPEPVEPAPAPKTTRPSAAPVARATRAPVARATRAPKAAPTGVPIISPTAAPVTATPTVSPTTSAPVADPTAVPILEPTGTPTPMPSTKTNCDPENPPCVHDFLGICYIYDDCGAIGNHDNYSFHTPFHFKHTHSPTLEPTPAIPCDPSNPPCTEWYLGFCMKITKCSEANHTDTYDEPVEHETDDEGSVTPTNTTSPFEPVSNSTATSIISSVSSIFSGEKKASLRSKKSK